MDDQPDQPIETKSEKIAYGKRPLWQWIVLYVVIGAVIYGAVYYFFIAKKGGYSNNSTSGQQQYTQPTNASPTSDSTSNNATSSNIYLTKTDPTKGTYIADFAGMTLYTYDKDTKGVSNCYSACATAWPPYSSGAVAQGQFPTDISVITRTDGSKQFAWKGMPLYYYAKDTKAGDITGDGVGGVWHLVKP